MTRDEILNMKAGRKLDAMIYQSVFKNRVEFLTSKLDPDYVEYLIPSDDTNYSTSIIDAWKVVEKLECDPRIILTDVIRASETGTFDGLKWYVRMRSIEGHGYWNASGDTAPLAICRTALLAVMEDK